MRKPADASVSSGQASRVGASFRLELYWRLATALTYWMVRALSSRPPNEVAILVAMSASMALMTAEGSLVAIWVGFGSRPLPVRLALAVPGCGDRVSSGAGLPNGNGALALGLGLILVAFASVPSLAARAAGWRVIRFPNVTDSTIWQPGDNPTQFTLRQMFSWTLAVAMVAGLCRLIIRPQDLRSGKGRQPHRGLGTLHRLRLGCLGWRVGGARTSASLATIAGRCADYRADRTIDPMRMLVAIDLAVLMITDLGHARLRC